MSFNTRTYISLLAFFIGSGVFAAPQESQSEPQPSAEAPSDTVFNEIRLTDEGVTAVDTSGFSWIYDFDSDRFIRGVKESELPREEGPFNELLDVLPVDQRCTEQIEFVPSTRSVLVGYDEYVEGSIRALGRVTVKGWVKGDVQSFRKRVVIAETGQVDGDVKAPSIIIKEGGQVLGRVIETGDIFDFEDLGVTFSPDGIIVVSSFIGFLLICGFLAISLMPKQMQEVRSCIENNKTRTYSLGFLFILLMPIIILLLIVTILGIPLAIILPLVYIAAMVIGTISFGGWLGGRLTKFISGNDGGLMFQSMIGVLLFMSLWMVVATLMGSTGKTANGFGIAFLVIAILISTYPVCAGVGASLLTRFGLKKYVSWKERRNKADSSTDSPAPPPIPIVPDHNSADQPPEHGNET